MSNFKFELNRKGVIEFLKSTEMQNYLREKSDDIQSRCGDGYEATVQIGTDRAVAFVRAETVEAKKDNSDNNTILKAVR